MDFFPKNSRLIAKSRLITPKKIGKIPDYLKTPDQLGERFFLLVLVAPDFFRCPERGDGGKKKRNQTETWGDFAETKRKKEEKNEISLRREGILLGGKKKKKRREGRLVTNAHMYNYLCLSHTWSRRTGPCARVACVYVYVGCVYARVACA